MKTRRFFQFFIVAGVLTLFATLFMAFVLGTPSPKEAHAQTNCTLKTLNGAYLWAATGTYTDTGKLHNLSQAGSWAFDGNGKIKVVLSKSIDYETPERREEYTLTYKLASGCTFIATDGDAEYDLYTTPSGSAMVYFALGTSTIMRRIDEPAAAADAQTNCTLKTLNGTYLWASPGSYTDAGTVHHVSEAGSWIFDGNGNIKVVLSSSIDNGSILERRTEYTLTYKLASDCNFIAMVGETENDLYATPSGNAIAHFSLGSSSIMGRGDPQ